MKCSRGKISLLESGRGVAAPRMEKCSCRNTLSTGLSDGVGPVAASGDVKFEKCSCRNIVEKWSRGMRRTRQLIVIFPLYVRLWPLLWLGFYNSAMNHTIYPTFYFLGTHGSTCDPDQKDS